MYLFKWFFYNMEVKLGNTALDIQVSCDAYLEAKRVTSEQNNYKMEDY